MDSPGGFDVLYSRSANLEVWRQWARLAGLVVYYYAKASGVSSVQSATLSRLLGIEADRLAEVMPGVVVQMRGSWQWTGAQVTNTRDNSSNEVNDVFDYWRARLGYKTAKLTNDRKSKVAARLREGYSVEDIKAAIDGCAGSAWHTGDNPNGKRYDDLTLICRNGSKLEHFREAARKSGGKGYDESAIAEAVYSDNPSRKAIRSLLREAPEDVRNKWIPTAALQLGVSIDQFRADVAGPGVAWL